VVRQPRAGRAAFGVGRLRGEQRGELRLASGAPEVDHELASHRGGGLATVIVGDERQRQVDAGGDPAEDHTLPPCT